MMNNSMKAKPRIAIIGGGIAGCTLAHILSSHFEKIDLFESSPYLLTGVSNSFWCRIHTGIHFPHQPRRGILTCFSSYATVQFYKNFLLDVKKPQYYCAEDPKDQLVVDGHLLSPERFIDFVKYLDSLTSDFRKQFPKGVELLGEPFWSLISPDDPSYPKSAGVGVSTNEAILDLPKLTKSFRLMLQNNPHVNLHLGAEIKTIERARGHTFLVTTSNGDKHSYDYVINATRAIPINRLDEEFRANANLASLTTDDAPELRFYAVLEDVNRSLLPCHQYVHGNKGVSYAYFPQTNLAIVEALPDTIIKCGDSNDDLLNWLPYTSKKGPLDHPKYRALASKILEAGREEYPVLSGAKVRDYYAAPMLQPSAIEHRAMHKLFFETPGDKSQIDPQGYFHIRNLKVTDTVLCAFHVFQQLCITHEYLGFQKEARDKTTVEFLSFLMEKYPSRYVLEGIKDTNYVLRSTPTKLVESYC